MIHQDTFHVQSAAASARYRERHPGRQTAAHARWRAKNPLDLAANRATNFAWSTANPIKGLIHQARRRAKRKGIPFTITEADISPLPIFCPVLGVRLNYGPGRGRKLYENGAAASLDRIRNAEGYIPGNVIVVSLRANLLKGQATIAELQKLASYYARYTPGFYSRAGG